MKFSRILAVGAAVALVGASAVFVGGAASAADDYVYVNASDFGVETSAGYPADGGWFRGIIANQGTIASTPAGLELDGANQILNGTTPTTGLVDLVNSARIDVASGTATFQIPLFADGDADSGFTTLRPVTAGADGLYPGTVWVTSQAIGTTYAAGATATLQEFQDALPANYQILGYGAYIDDGDSAVIQAITWNGTTSIFTPKPTVGTVTPSTISVTGIATTGVNVTLNGFAAGEIVDQSMGTPGGSGGATGATFTADADGNVSFTFTKANMVAGQYFLGAIGEQSNVSSSVSFTVVADVVPGGVTPPVATPAAAVPGKASFTG